MSPAQVEDTQSRPSALTMAGVAIVVIVTMAWLYVEPTGSNKNVILAGAVVVIAGLVCVSAIRRMRHRQSALAQIASVLGFSFRVADEEWTACMATLPFMKRKGSPNIRNVMRGVTESREVVLCDYMFIDGDTVRRQTAAVFRLRKDRLPPFELQPEGFLQNLFGGGDIDFASHREFSARYFLRSPDEQAVRALFQPRVLDALSAKHETWVVQGDREYLAMYRPHVTVRPTPDAMRAFLNEASSIVAVFGKV